MLILGVIPLAIYFAPAFLSKWIFFSSVEPSIPKWTVYGAPLLAWIGSLVLRSVMNRFIGMGNLVWEPLWLALCPALFWLGVAKFTKPLHRLGSPRFSEALLMAAIALLATASFLNAPANGDWP